MGPDKGKGPGGPGGDFNQEMGQSTKDKFGMKNTKDWSSFNKGYSMQGGGTKGMEKGMGFGGGGKPGGGMGKMGGPMGGMGMKGKMGKK